MVAIMMVIALLLKLISFRIINVVEYDCQSVTVGISVAIVY